MLHTDADNMRHLLACLHRKRMPAGGLAFAAVWDKLALDYTPASLNRLSTLLHHISTKQPNAFAQLQSSRAGQNFLLIVSAYLAEYVARYSGAAYTWQLEGKAVFGTWPFQPLSLLCQLLSGKKNTLNLDEALWRAFCANPDADRSKMAQWILGYYRRRQTAPNGLAFTAELSEVNLDGSADSLFAIDQMLAKLRDGERLTPANFHSRFSHSTERNFLLLLAFYLGETLTELSGGAVAEWRNTPQGGDAFYDAFVLILEGRELPLLRMLENALSEGKTRFRLPEKATAAPIPPDPNAAARRAVDGLLNPHFNARATPPAPLAYTAELKAAVLDYSMRSLAQLDKLLLKIRAAQPDFDAFVHEPAQLNFLHFCAFYLARTAAELSHNTLKFIDYEEAKQQLPDLPQDWFSQYAAVIGERIYFPFGRILALIWDGMPEASCCALFAQNACREQSGTLYQCSALIEHKGSGNLTDLARKALRQAGFTAAYGLSQRAGLPENGVLIPLLLEPHPEKHWNMLQLMFDDTDSALVHGMAALEQNPDNLPCRIFCYEGYVNLPRGRFDALMLEIRTYRGNCPFTLQAALPFLPDESGRMVVGSLALNGNSIANEQEAAAIAECIYRGMDDFHEPTHGKRYWRRLYRRYL